MARYLAKLDENNIVIDIIKVGGAECCDEHGNIDEEKAIAYIKSKLGNKSIKILYGGSVNSNNVDKLKIITGIDGFLIGGASQNSNKFIDIIKKTIN